MSPEPWKPPARPTYATEWTTCATCGKRYVIRLPPSPKLSYKDVLSYVAGEVRRGHVCRTERQEKALADYEEMEPDPEDTEAVGR